MLTPQVQARGRVVLNPGGGTGRGGKSLTIAGSMGGGVCRPGF